MSERFETLYKLGENLYAASSPIIISAGVLLKDTKTESVITQLKFQSVTQKTIKALKVSISAYDISGKIVNGIEDYQYLDLHIKNGEFFGFNKAIVMPESIARSIKIEKILVILEDENHEIDGDNLFSISKSKKLSDEYSDSNIIKQYQIDSGTDGEYIPKLVEDLWICACGKPNSTDVCTGCFATKEKVFVAYNPIALENHLKNRLEEERAEEERRLQLEETKRKENEEREKHEAELKAKEEMKRKRKIRLYSIIGVVLTVIIIAIASISSSIRHKDAIADIELLISENQHEHAFDRVNDSNLSSSEKENYKNKLIPLMKKQFKDALESSEALNIDGLKIYENNDVIYYKSNNGDTIQLYEMADYDDDRYIIEDFIYANGYIFFAERYLSYTNANGNNEYRENVRYVNINTGKSETLEYSCDFYDFCKLEDGRVFVNLSYENDIVFDPYTGTKKPRKGNVTDYEVENAIYSTNKYRN